jgi:hypothetical protein
VEKEEPVQDNFNADLSANVLRLGQPRSGNASTGQHKFLERVVRHRRLRLSKNLKGIYLGLMFLGDV